MVLKKSSRYTKNKTKITGQYTQKYQEMYHPKKKDKPKQCTHYLTTKVFLHYKLKHNLWRNIITNHNIHYVYGKTEYKIKYIISEQFTNSRICDVSCCIYWHTEEEKWLLCLLKWKHPMQLQTNTDKTEHLPQEGERERERVYCNKAGSSTEWQASAEKSKPS